MGSANKIVGKCALLLLLISWLIGCTPAPQAPKTYTVEIKDMQFVPHNIIVRKGDTIVWINRDMMAHDVTEEKKTWTSAPIQSGASWKMAVSENADYYCSIHMIMKGKIELE